MPLDTQARTTTATPTSRTVTFGRRRIHFSELGTGFPVILLHGGGPGASGMSNYARNVEALAKDFRVIVPDMQGYGRSSKGVDREDPFGDLADATLGFMDAIGLPAAHLVGNSLGGSCALRMALDAPRRVTSLVLMGPGGIGTTRTFPSKGLRLLLGYYGGSGPSRQKLEELLRGYLVHDGRRISDELIEARYRSSIEPEVVASPPLQRPGGLRAALRMDFTRDRRLRSCATPTLVIWGAEDKVNRPSGARALQEAMPNCDVYVVSKTGHWVQWERAAEFNAVTAAFLREHTPT